MPKFGRFVMTVNVGTTGAPSEHEFYFQAPTGSYTGIETQCGVSELTETAEAYRFPACSVEQMVLSNVCSRRKLRLNDASGNRERYKEVLVAKHLLAGFAEAAVGKTVNGGKIVRYAYEPTKNRYRA
jgi:hypothetical protein